MENICKCLRMLLSDCRPALAVALQGEVERRTALLRSTLSKGCAAKNSTRFLPNMVEHRHVPNIPNSFLALKRRGDRRYQTEFLKQRHNSDNTSLQEKNISVASPERLLLCEFWCLAPLPSLHPPLFPPPFPLHPPRRRLLRGPVMPGCFCQDSSHKLFHNANLGARWNVSSHPP